MAEQNLLISPISDKINTPEKYEIPGIVINNFASSSSFIISFIFSSLSCFIGID
ncbi:MAG: hypothetical protein NC824_03730 [Candidatus Omnitrophica bacterium]|nr:hypothetical protein [Candidatus Omnitrophota bacterium]